MSETILLIRRVGIDKGWQVAPYDIKSEQHLERVLKLVRKTMPEGVELETKIIRE